MILDLGAPHITSISFSAEDGPKHNSFPIFLFIFSLFIFLSSGEALSLAIQALLSAQLSKTDLEDYHYPQ